MRASDPEAGRLHWALRGAGLFVLHIDMVIKTIDLTSPTDSGGKEDLEDDPRNAYVFRPFDDAASPLRLRVIDSVQNESPNARIDDYLLFY